MLSFPSLQSSPINFIQGKILKNIQKKHIQILANNCRYNYFITKAEFGNKRLYCNEFSHIY